MRHRGPCSSVADLRGGLVLAFGLLLLLPSGCGGGVATEATAGSETVAVERGNLRITVLEGGDLESAKPVSIRSELEGRSAILGLIPEGTQVKKGDWLIKLDSSTIQDNLNRQEIKLEDARSALAQAEEAVAIQEKKNQEDERAAQTAYELAERAYTAYLDEKNGTQTVELGRLKSAVVLAEEKLNRAQDKRDGSERLFKKTYISETEYEADVLAFNQTKVDLQIAQANLEHFKQFTAADEIQKLTSDRDVKKLALDRVRQQAQSELKQKQDSLEARKKAYVLEKEARDKMVVQLEKATINAPADGLVVYARQDRGGRMGGNEPIGLGKEVREQEEILRIPDLSQMVVQVNIHESSIKKVQNGQKAWVRVDAIPTRTFPGTVTRVSLVPSTQSSWMNPDLKVYETIVKLEETLEGVKPGMHAQVEILVQEIPGALQIPLQAVRQSGSKTFAYLKDGSGKPLLREIKVGLNNNSAVHIIDGLTEGELVYLTPPPGAPPLPEPETTPFLPPEGPAVPGSPGEGPASDNGGPGGRPFDDGNMPPRGPGGRRGAMTEEQRKAWEDRMKNMTPEERERMREGMRRRGGGGGAEGRPDRRPGSEGGGGGGGEPTSPSEGQRRG